MLQATMHPYRKQYDRNGQLIRPGNIFNKGLNRQQRRRYAKNRPHGTKRRAQSNLQRAAEHFRRVFKLQKRSRKANRRKKR